MAFQNLSDYYVITLENKALPNNLFVAKKYFASKQMLKAALQSIQNKRLLADRNVRKQIATRVKNLHDVEKEFRPKDKSMLETSLSSLLSGAEDTKYFDWKIAMSSNLITKEEELELTEYKYFNEEDELVCGCKRAHINMFIVEAQSTLYRFGVINAIENPYHVNSFGVKEMIRPEENELFFKQLNPYILIPTFGYIAGESTNKKFASFKESVHESSKKVMEGVFGDL